MARMLKREQVLKIMRKRQGGRSQKDFAADLGVSQQLLCDIYLGRKEPGPKVLHALGLARHVRYEKQ